MIQSAKQLLTYLYRLSPVNVKAGGKYLKGKKLIKKQTGMNGVQKKMETFVFLDLETTGLFRANGVPPRITEIGMVAVLRDSFCNDSNRELSRVKYKLVIPLNPAEEISQQVEEITGFSNKGLKQLQPFTTNTKIILNTFLQQLKRPICFVAHNGNKFDYPILLSELEKIGMLDLEGTIYTIDSFEFFKYYFRRRKEQVKGTVGDKVTESAVGSNVAFSTLLDDGYDSVLSDALDSFTQSFSECDQSLQPEFDFLNTFACRSNVKANSLEKLESYNYTEQMRKTNEKTPENQIIKSAKVHANFQTGARRRLDFPNTSNTLPNHKLTTIYKHIFDTESSDKHTAEGDCITLLQCAMKVGNIFVEWADDHAVNLYSHRRS